jgi:hypothetical protein
VNTNTLNPLVTRLITLWFVGMSLLAAVGGSIWLVCTFWFVAHASKAEGHIVAMERRGSSKGSPMYSPVFAFNDASGITHTQMVSMSSSDFSYEAGGKVTVLYDPTRPIHSTIDSFTTLWFFPLVIIGISLMTASFLVVWLVVFKNIMKRQQSWRAI